MCALLHDPQLSICDEPTTGVDPQSLNHLFLLFYGLEAARGLLTERAEGTLTRLRVAPIPAVTALAATGLSTVVIGLVMTAAVYAVGIAAFGIRVLGSVPGFLLVLVAQATLVGGFALLLAGVGRSEKQIASSGSLLVLVRSFAGGAMFPSFLMPEWLQMAATALPTKWATQGLAAMTWRGFGFGAAAVPSAVLFGAGALCGAVGIRSFRWED